MLWWASQVARICLPMQETPEMRVRFLGQEDPLEKEMATHSSILAWEIPWTEEPGGPQSMGLRRVRHDYVHRHTSVVLVSALRQSESAICVHISPPSLASPLTPHPTPPHPSRSSQSSGWTPCAIQQLLTSHLFYTCSICMSVLLFQLIPAFLAPCPKVCSLCLSLFLTCKTFFFEYWF